MTDNTHDTPDQVHDPSHGRWSVVLDPEKCTLCEVCARICPTDALTRVKKDSTMSLYFNQTLCIGCPGEISCEALCPEDAIKIIELDAKPERQEEVLLNEDEMIQCSNCKEFFAPLVKVRNIGRKGLPHNVNLTLCPLCRRTNLVVQLIDDKLSKSPTDRAQYRSTREILRRARFRLFKDEKNEKDDKES